VEEWPPEDLWLRKFLTEQQKTFNGVHLPYLLDYGFWERTGIGINGLSLPMLEREFAKMGNWLADHRSRTPLPKGVRRFVAGWLERSADRERRFPNGAQK